VMFHVKHYRSVNFEQLHPKSRLAQAAKSRCPRGEPALVATFHDVKDRAGTRPAPIRYSS
jgi:hypothetical protein